MKPFNCVEDKLPILPDHLSAQIKQYRYYMLNMTEEKLSAFSTAYALFADYQSQHPISSTAQCNVIFTSLDAVMLMYDNHSIHGHTATLVTIFLQRIRTCSQYDKIYLSLVLLEELLHALYLITDEWEVKEITAAIVRQKFPALQLHYYFPGYFDESDHCILFDLESELLS